MFDMFDCLKTFAGAKVLLFFGICKKKVPRGHFFRLVTADGSSMIDPRSAQCARAFAGEREVCHGGLAASYGMG